MHTVVCVSADHLDYSGRLMRNNRPQNIIGANVRIIRNGKGWTQADLARKYQLKGFDITRTGISQVEGFFRRVTDHKMVLIAKALRVPVTDLIPKRLPPWVGRGSKEDTDACRGASFFSAPVHPQES